MEMNAEDGRMNAGPKNRCRLKWSILGMALLMGIGLVWWNRETIRIWYYFVHPLTVPRSTFDAGKAASLSAERRAELERELFTEMYLWNTDSRRYDVEEGLDSASNRRLAYCWGYQAASYRFSEPDLSLVAHRNEAASEQRELLGRELDQLRQ